MSGDSIKIYYSKDNGTTWDFHAYDSVELINGDPYVEFTTTHYTDFALQG
ncbi:MAG: hypothetical protein WCL18_04915 [bacterium]